MAGLRLWWVMNPLRRSWSTLGLALGLALVAMPLVACGGSSSTGDGGPAIVDAGFTEDGDPGGPDAGPPQNPLTGIGAVELVEEGFQFTEGPQWRETTGDLLFTDISANQIKRYVPGGAVTTFRDGTQGANGLAVDGDGVLHAAVGGGKNVSRVEDEAFVALVDDFEGDAFNSPNDLVIADDGTIYFTDPPFNGLGPLGFAGVFRLAPAGALHVEDERPASARPNGLALSPDGSVLYVADTTGKVARYAVGADGALGEPADLADAPNGDGMAVDAAGNLFVTASDGVRVFAPDGTAWGTIAVPRQPSNCAFGDADHRTLYITARQGLYKVRLAGPGLPTR